MAETDIYKNTERRNTPATPQKSGRRRRRSSSRRSFDEKDRSKHMRRSRNSGARRFRHVWKKADFQKRLTWTLSILGIIFVILVGIWQFWYQDYAALKELEQRDQDRAAQARYPELPTE